MTAISDFLLVRMVIAVTALIFAIVNGVAAIRRKKVTERAYPAAQIFPLLYVAYVLGNPAMGRCLGGVDTELAIFLILVTGLAERITNND